MDTIDAILQGLGQAFHWQPLLFLVIGVAVGDVAAAIPGLSALQAIALLLPFTGYLPTMSALGFLVGIYTGGCFGGSTTAILINTPGTAEAAATVLDGYPLAQKGQAGKALRMALWASATGSLLASLVLIFGFTLLVPVALKIGPPEYFALIFAALTIIGVVGQASPAKSLIAASLGFLLASMGQDPFHGAIRFDTGILALSSGIPLVPMIIGLFAVSEIMEQFAIRKSAMTAEEMGKLLRDPSKQILSMAEYRKSMPTIVRSSMIGAGIGALPGLGGAIAAVVSYGVARRLSKHPERFGTGELDGVAAAEAGNSGTVGPTMIPLLTLGIPGSGTAALFIPAFLMHGIQVGPRILESHAPVVYGLLTLFFLSAFANLAVGLGVRALAVRILTIPRSFLFPTVLLMALVGSYTSESNLAAVGVALFFGGLGYGMRKFGFPTIPLLIAFVLGGLTETSLGRSLLILENPITGFLGRPIALAFFAIALAVILLMARSSWSARRG